MKTPKYVPQNLCLLRFIYIYTINNCLCISYYSKAAFKAAYYPTEDSLPF